MRVGPGVLADARDLPAHPGTGGPRAPGEEAGARLRHLEYCTWLAEEALQAAPAAPPSLGARAVNGLGSAALFGGDPFRAVTACGEALALARQSGDLAEAAYILLVLHPALPGRQPVGSHIPEVS